MTLELTRPIMQKIIDVPHSSTKSGSTSTNNHISSRFPSSMSYLEGHIFQSQKLYVHTHLPLMDSPSMQTGWFSINMLGTVAAKIFPRLRLYLQGQRSWGQNDHAQTLASVASICWTQLPQDFRCQGHNSKIYCHGSKMTCSCIATPREYAAYPNWLMSHQ